MGFTNGHGLTFAGLRRKPEYGQEIRRILNLPDDNWTDVEVQFALDEPATAKVTFFLTGSQFQELAELAARPT